MVAQGFSSRINRRNNDGRPPLVIALQLFRRTQRVDMVSPKSLFQDCHLSLQGPLQDHSYNWSDSSCFAAESFRLVNIGLQRNAGWSASDHWPSLQANMLVFTYYDVFVSTCTRRIYIVWLFLILFAPLSQSRVKYSYEQREVKPFWGIETSIRFAYLPFSVSILFWGNARFGLR